MSNTNSNDAAFAYLDHYLDRAPHGEGVVLVSGRWGSGKTHTLRAYMAARDRRVLKTEPLADKHLYISLYGVSAIDQVYERLFAAKHPIAGSGLGKMIATIATRAGNLGAGGSAIERADGAAVRRYLLSLRDTVLVLDDLERSAMPVSEIMGWLNTLIEHERIKAILVCDEDRIGDTWPEFVAGKEKLVARTVVLKSSASDVYDGFAKRLRMSEASAAASVAKDSVLHVFEVSGQPNLRSLRAVLDDFDRLVAETHPALRESPRALQILLPIMAALWIAVRAGEITTRDFDEEHSVLYELFIVRSRADDAPTPSKAATALGRHAGMDFTDSPAPVGSLVRFAATGELDVENINLALAQHPAVVGLRQVAPWRQLWRWRSLKVSEFGEAVDALREQMARGELQNPEALLHLMGIALDLQANGFELLDPNPLLALTRYIEERVASGTLEPNLDGLDGFGSTSGLGYSASEEPDFGVFRERLHAATLAARDQKLQIDSNVLLERLQSGDLLPLREHDFENGLYAAIPALHHLPVEAFADMLLKDGAVERKLRAAMLERYRNWGQDDHPLRMEADWIADLQAELSKRIITLPVPHRTEAESSFTELFRRIRMSLGSTTTETRP